jgi:putative transposase
LFSRKRLRLRGFDYSSDGHYLVTDCTHDRRCILGTLGGEAVITSQLGAIVARQIELLPERLPGVGVDGFVVMPCTRRRASPEGEASLAPTVAIGSFKSGSAREINVFRGTPGAKVWQRGYHDHVVRDEDDLERILDYVASNPIRWLLDPETPGRTP